MSAKTKIEKITVKIGELELNLTHEEAKSLYATLGEIVGRSAPFVIERAVKEYVPTFPYYSPNQWGQLPNTPTNPYTVTCGQFSQSMARQLSFNPSQGMQLNTSRTI